MSATLQMSRLEWLLQGVLETQQLVTDAEFDLDVFMQRVVDLDRLGKAHGGLRLAGRARRPAGRNASPAMVPQRSAGTIDGRQPRRTISPKRSRT